MREHDLPRAGRVNRRNRFDDDEPDLREVVRRRSRVGRDPRQTRLGDRWSTWDLSTPTERGPLPHPDWLVTELAAVDVERGVLKTGKEADVFLLHRHVPGTDRGCLLAAKRYRSHDHRHVPPRRGLPGGSPGQGVPGQPGHGQPQRVRQGGDRRALGGGRVRRAVPALGDRRQLDVAPFTPYPVQILGTEVLQEFIGTPDGTAAPRLAQVRTDEDGLADLWAQLMLGLPVLARAGYAHGDLSPYNILVHEGRLVIIDLPQIVDVVANPQGKRVPGPRRAQRGDLVHRRGLSGLDEAAVTAELMAEARHAHRCVRSCIVGIAWQPRGGGR